MPSLFIPRLVNDAFGDPGLFVDFCDERRALLFDLGDLSRLMPRELLRLSHVFVTHAHMDHFAGFDQLLRIILGRKANIVVFGGPGFLDQVEHKLRAYTWNVAHRYDELIIEAREFAADADIPCARFSSRRGFEREACPALPHKGDVIHEEATFRVRARLVDHGMPCLAYAVEEKARINVDKERLVAEGLGAGAWLRTLKHAVLTGADDETPLVVEWRDQHGEHTITRTIGELSKLILDVTSGQRVGYVTDLRYTEANVATLEQLLAGVDRLFIESVFLDEDRDHGLKKNHLTARQAGLIARRVGAAAAVPFHFSPRYADRGDEVETEMLAAWSDADAPDEAPNGTTLTRPSDARNTPDSYAD
ncbi:MAG TPA: MBL fold metallo-hydrolase [Aromatoleum sp.]|uniref:ribonuclease Z n=1 Tax=Aromatoleum sp. TaxID=2307007 RepID=UPI002B4A6F79|nr:MBL fold metallo-hydrolase [Aromatoleum sp.]HJV26799.1 MBL fold metallo-hydrolase [Aromatoleum sp.]